MFHNPLDLTPFRPELIALLSVKSWAAFEMIGAVCVIALSFLQKKHDGNKRVSDVLGFISYMSLVLKAAFAFSVLWDGMYVSLHEATEYPRPIVSVAIAILALQQVRDVLGKITANRIVQSRPAALFIGELPPAHARLDEKVPEWVFFLVDTEAWVRALIPKSKLRP